MADTYSTRLRLRMQETGANVGTWGGLNNLNLGTLLEAAIAGVATVAMPDANYTLTVADGSPDEARCAVLLLTGTLTAARDVIIPAVQKSYLVVNDTDFAVTIRVSGQAGVAVKAGGALPVWCDGTDTWPAVTWLPALDADVVSQKGSPLWSPGDIKASGRAAAEAGWLLCDGSAVSRTDYADLFAAIGTTFGGGNGSTTFNIPDLRGRVVVGKDDMGGTAAGRITLAATGLDALVLGAGGGDQMAMAHSHTATTGSAGTHAHGGSTSSDGVHAHVQITADGTGSLAGPATNSGSTTTNRNDTGTAGLHSHSIATDAQGAHTHTVAVAAALTGGAQNVQPSMIFNYFIKT